MRRLVIGIRFRGASPAEWTASLDNHPLPFEETGREDYHGFRRALALLDLPQRDVARNRRLRLLHDSAFFEVQDLIVRARGFGDDPIADELLMEEGRYWSKWVGVHVAAGDRTITDGQYRGTHPSFLPIGIVAPDTRDLSRCYGFYPDRFTKFLLSPLSEKSGGWGLDIGTGCGQFALQAARQGLRMIGIDLGEGLLQLGRNTAAEHPELSIDYIRSEARFLPFRAETFDAITAKESLHHLEHVKQAFAEIRRTLKIDGIFVASEHVAATPWLERLFIRTTMFLRPLILRRHPTHSVPSVLTYPSPLEDRGANDILPIFRHSFKRRRTRSRWMLVDFVQMHVHYAFRRWRWLAGPPLIATAWLIEAALRLVFARPLSTALEGREKKIWEEP